MLAVSNKLTQLIFELCPISPVSVSVLSPEYYNYFPPLVEDECPGCIPLG